MSSEDKSKSFTITWKIKNFSFYSLAENKELLSPAWKTETTQGSERWKLGVYCSEPNICFLLINLKGDNNHGQYEITLLTSHGEILLKSLSTNLYIPCIAKTKILDDKGLSILPQDILTISCRILNQTVLPGECRLHTALQKVKFIWEIKDFKDFNFYLSIPRALHEEGNILLSMFFLYYDDNGTFDVQVELLPNISGWSTFIDCHINIKDGLGKAISDTRGSQCWSFDIKTKSETSTNLQLELESLLAMNLRFQQNPTSSATVGDDLLFLLKEGLHSDATLNTEGKSFKAHKGILAARSSVFRTMFADECLTEDRWWEVVEIDDVDSATMERMLVFIYTDSLENMQWDEAKALVQRGGQVLRPCLERKVRRHLEG